MSNEASKQARLAVASLGRLRQATSKQRALLYRQSVEAILYELEGNNTRQTEESIEIFIDAIVDIIRDLHYVSEDDIQSREGFSSYLKQAKIRLESSHDRAQKKGTLFYKLISEAADQLTLALKVL